MCRKTNAHENLFCVNFRMYDILVFPFSTITAVSGFGGDTNPIPITMVEAVRYHPVVITQLNVLAYADDIALIGKKLNRNKTTI
jgi:hypothetical protein